MSLIVSVIIPTYNREKSIINTLNSIINQDYKDLEIIIVDDGSTDGTELSVAALVKTDSRIKYIKQQNSGVSEVRNRGISVLMEIILCLLIVMIFFHLIQ